MMDRQVIITCDDAGYAPRRDDGIIDALSVDAITHCSLLVNGINAKRFARRIREMNRMNCLGLHLNLTEGKAISGHLPSLTHLDGTFKFDKFQLRENQSKLESREVKQEIKAQIEKFMEFASQLPSHLDGHQHVHILPTIFPILVELIRKYQREGDRTIRLRFPSEVLIPNWIKTSERKSFHAKVMEDARSARALCVQQQQQDLVFNSHFLGMFLFMDDDGMDLEESLKRFWLSVRSIPSTCVLEIMVHAGNSLDSHDVGGFEKPDQFSMSKMRKLELDFLLSGKAVEILKNLEQFENVTVNAVTPRLLKKKKIMILSSGIPYTGNFSTSDRLRRIFFSLNYDCFIIDVNSIEQESLEHIFKVEQVDLVVGIHAYHAGKFFLTNFAIPTVLILGGTDMNEMLLQNQQEIGLALRRCVKIVSFTEDMKRKCLATYPMVESSKVHLIRQSFYTDYANCKGNQQKPKSDGCCFCNSWKKTKPLVLLPVGIRKVKDPMFLLEEVIENFSEEIEFVIIGSILDVALHEEMMKQIKSKKNNRGCVRYMKPILHNEFIRAMKCCVDVVVNSSISEGMCNVLLEGMSIGRSIVIARANEGNKAIVSDEETGFLFETPSQFTKILKRCLAWENRQEMERIKKNASEAMRRNFSLEMETSAYEKLLGGILTTNGTNHQQASL